MSSVFDGSADAADVLLWSWSPSLSADLDDDVDEGGGGGGGGGAWWTEAALPLDRAEMLMTKIPRCSDGAEFFRRKPMALRRRLNNASERLPNP